MSIQGIDRRGPGRAPSAEALRLRAPGLPRSAAAMAGAVSVVLWTAGCDSLSSANQAVHLQLDPPGPGVVFSYPGDGQYDVPLGARIALTFSAVLPAAPNGACSKSGGQVSGDFCVEGPDGFVSGALAVEGATLAFAPVARLAPGATYRVWALPTLLPGATNLSAQGPLLTFHARSTRALGGQAATVLTVNGSPLNADGTSPLPFLSEAPIRLLFSEPLDPTTVTTTAARLVRSADGTPVEGVIIAQGVHLTFQQAQALDAGEGYELQLTAAVHDLGGEPIAPVSLKLTPRRTAVPNEGLYPLELDVEPAWTDGVGQPTSRLGAMPVNSNVLSSQLVGSNAMGVMAGGLEALAGNPQVMGTPIPMILRRGQRLDLTPLVVRLGGAVDAALQTGTLHFMMLTDAVGFLRRNPFRSPDQEPDDAQAPTAVEFTMDAVISGEDARGNTVATQTVMGVHLTGLSTLDGDQLAIDSVGALEFDLMGVDTAPVALALRLRTGAKAPVPALAAPALVSSFPADGAKGVSPADPVELNFSAPLDPARIRDGVELTLTEGSAVVATHPRLEGTTVVIAPSRRLAEGAVIALSYSGLRSMSGAPVAGGSLSFTTAASTAGQAAAPILTALTPGAPCALTGVSAASPGHCAGGKPSDTGYLPFTLPANRDILAQFSQAIDPASLSLGAACGQGSFRVESLGANGQCAAAVEGSLVKRDRAVRFVANKPWVPGASYRLTLVGGGNASCGTGEVCGRNGKPLNTDPLSGAGSDAGGGPDVVIDFQGAPATFDTFQPLASDPAADQSGDGTLDAAEQANDANRVVMEIAGHSGIITNASLGGADCLPARPGQQVCSYLTATLPVSVRGPLASCPLDAQGNPSTAANPCVEVQVYPSTILGTSTSMNTTALGLIPINNLPTGMMVMRLREMGAPILGYILREPGSASPEFVIRQELYFDAPDLSIPLATHDLASKKLSVTLKGPVTFRPDGRMDIALRSLADVTLTVNISALLLPGSIDLRIPAGEMRVTLAGPLNR